MEEEILGNLPSALLQESEEVETLETSMKTSGNCCLVLLDPSTLSVAEETFCGVKAEPPDFALQVRGEERRPGKILVAPSRVEGEALPGPCDLSRRQGPSAPR